MTLLTMLLRGALPLVPLVFIVLFVTLTILNRVLRCQDPNHADLQLHQSVHGQQNVQGQQGESDIIHNQRIYHSSYVIWENYPLGASDTSSNHNITTSPNFLAAKLLWHIRAPLTEYQQAQLAIRSKIPALNAFVC